MKWAVLILAACLILGCANKQICIREGGPDDPPKWTVEVPAKGELTFEQTKDKETVKIVVNTEGSGWNPINAAMEMITGAVALVFNRGTPITGE